MKYALHFGPESLNINLEGVFSFIDSLAFRRLLGTLNLYSARSEIRLNIRKLESIDATALELLLFAHDIAKRNHRPLIYEQPQGQVHEALARAAKHNALIIAT